MAAVHGLRDRGYIILYTRRSDKGRNIHHQEAEADLETAVGVARQIEQVGGHVYALLKYENVTREALPGHGE